MASEVASLKLQVQQLEAQLAAAGIRKLGSSHDDSSFSEEKKGNNYMDVKPVYPHFDPDQKSKILGKPPTIHIPFNKPCLFPECGDYIQKAFEAGKLSGDGLNSRMCTEWFAERLGYKHSLLMPSCTAALEMAALLLDLGPGDKVIVPSFTFVSTANAFALRGVTLVFGDSKSEHPNMSVEDVLSKITDKTKAIVVVHYAGAPIDVTRLAATGIPVVEDCAHAIGTFDPYTNDYIGKSSCLSTFSFHETKNVGIGEGGLLVVNDEKLWEKAQIIREKGTNHTAFRENRADFYTWYSLGSSYLLSDVDAGVLLGCLNHFDEIQDRRLAIWDQYNRCLLPSTLFQKPRKEDYFNAHMYFIKFHDPEMPNEFNKYMKENGIMVASHYRPLDQSPFAKGANGQAADLPPCKNAEEWSRTLVRLPLFYGLSSMNVDKIIKVINAFSSRKDALTLQPAEYKHFDTIRVIRNNHKHSFWNVEEIDWDTHLGFMTKYASSYRVAVDKDGEVVGFIGEVRGDARLAVRQDTMRKGVAQFMWENFVREFPNVTVKVKRDNERSLDFFKKVGWVPDQPQWEAGNDPVDLVAPKQL